MRVRLNTPRTGGGQVGDIIDVPADEAAKLIARGSASPVRARKKERAVKPDRAERAVK